MTDSQVMIPDLSGDGKSDVYDVLLAIQKHQEKDKNEDA